MKRFPPYPSKAHATGQARITMHRRSLWLGPFGSPQSWDEYGRLLKLWTAGHKEAFQPAPRKQLALRVADVVKEFLAWSSRHVSKSTHDGYHWYAQKMVTTLGECWAKDLRPLDVMRWADGNHWNPTTVYNALRIAFRVFSWAVDAGLLDANPLARLKRPRPDTNRRALTQEEFRSLLRGSSPAFRRLAVALWWTGARPKELREATWKQLHGDRLILAHHKTRRATRRDRVIYLPLPVQRLLMKLNRECNTVTPSVTPIFLNDRGQPWTANALRLAVDRAKVRNGLPEGCCAYAIRHAWAGRAMTAGLSAAVAAELMGNSPAVLLENYAHLDQQHAHLAKEMNRVGRAG